jgi:hypothetical protein
MGNGCSVATGVEGLRCGMLKIIRREEILGTRMLVGISELLLSKVKKILRKRARKYYEIWLTSIFHLYLGWGY